MFKIHGCSDGFVLLSLCFIGVFYFVTLPVFRRRDMVDFEACEEVYERRGEERGREGRAWGMVFGLRPGILGCQTLVFSPPRWQSSLSTRTSVGGVITIAAIYMYF